MLVKNCYQLCGWLFVFNQANYSGYCLCLLYLTILLLSYMDEHLVSTMGKLKHWLNLHHQHQYYCRTQHHLLLFMVNKNNRLSKLVSLNMLYPSCLYTQEQPFLFDDKYHHIRYTIQNSCWYSIYIMQYAFNMLTRHECT